MQSPSIWQQANTDDNVKNNDNKENDNLVSWQDKTIANAEVLVYAKQLQDYGINVQTHTVFGAPHGFIDLMSVHEGVWRETVTIIDNFATFVRQIIDTDLKVIKSE